MINENETCERSMLHMIFRFASLSFRVTALSTVLNAQLNLILYAAKWFQWFPLEIPNSPIIKSSVRVSPISDPI